MRSAASSRISSAESGTALLAPQLLHLAASPICQEPNGNIFPTVFTRKFQSHNCACS